MQDFGLLLRIITAAFKLFVLLFRVLWFCGIYWLILVVSLFSIVEKMLGKPIHAGSFLDYVSFGFFLIALVLMALTTIHNIIRFLKKDPKFSLYGTIFRKLTGNKAVGFVANIKLDNIKNLSGFVFGKLKGKYVTKKEEIEGHMLIIGGAGSGKSSCIAIPTLMSWKDRIFAIDVKGELYKTTSSKRDKYFIKVFNPDDINANGYDPLYILKHSDDPTEAVKEIAQAIIPLPAEIKDPYWITGAQNILAGSILYYSGMGMNFTQIMETIQSQPIKVIVNEIMGSENFKAKLFISNYAALKDETLGGIASEISGKILPFAANEALRQALDGHGDCITPNDLENGYDIYICIAESKIEQWRALLTMICNQFLKAFERRLDGNNNPILFMLDEFPRLGKIEAITNGLATLRSKKIQIALFVQSKSQLNAIYGKDVAEVIADNCNYKAILKASEPATQEWCSKLVGTYDKQKFSSNVNANMMGIGKGTGVSKTTEEKRIIKPEEFAFMQDIVCLFPTGYQRIQKAPYYLDSAFKNK